MIVPISGLSTPDRMPTRLLAQIKRTPEAQSGNNCPKECVLTLWFGSTVCISLQKKAQRRARWSGSWINGRIATGARTGLCLTRLSIVSASYVVKRYAGRSGSSTVASKGYSS